MIDKFLTGGFTLTLPRNVPQGTYRVVVEGYAVDGAGGSTAYDYRDAYLSPDLGSVAVDEEQVISLANGATAAIDADS